MAYKKLLKCKYCELKFEDMSNSQVANHSRWCNKNPKRKSYVASLEHVRSCATKESKERNRLGIIKAHASGKYANAYKKGIETKRKNGNLGHTEETKLLLRKKALASPHRRLKKGTVMYKGILLDSSWELALAKRLDFLEIEWIRPKPLPWTDALGTVRNYFPDFYLTEHNIYLDPKNPQAIRVQKEKLDCLLKQYKNIIIIDSLTGCNEYDLPG